MRYVPYTSELFEEDGQVVVLCHELNVSSYGNTAEEALDSLKEAVALFLDECHQMGTLEIILEEAGYHQEPGNS
jgi:predicted RNase H-like HicB family nuclease